MSRPYHVLEYEIDWTRNHPSKLSKVNKRKSQVHKYSRSNESPGSKDDILAETNTEMIHSNGLYGFGVSPPKIKRKSKQVARKDAYSPLLATTEPSQLTTSLDSSRNVDVEQEDDVTNQRYFADHSMEKGGMLDESLELKEPSTSESRFEPLSSFFDRCDKRMARFGPDHIRAQGKKSMESRMEETILKAKHDKLRLDRMLDKLQTDIRQSGVGSKVEGACNELHDAFLSYSLFILHSSFRGCGVSV